MDCKVCSVSLLCAARWHMCSHTAFTADGAEEANPMELFSRGDVRGLLANRQTPCVSFFMPTTRGVGHEDSKRFKNLVRELEERLPASGLA